MTNEAFPKLNRRGQTPRRVVFSSAAILTAFLASLSLTFTSMAATEYHVGLAGEAKRAVVHTFDTDPKEITQYAGVTVGHEDVCVMTSIRGGANSNVTVYKNGEITVEADGETYTIPTEGTVVNTLKKGGIPLRSGDSVNVDPNSPAYDGMELHIDRAFTITVLDGSTPYFCRSTDCTVSQVLDDLGLTLQEGDAVSVPLGTLLTEDTIVRIERLTVRTITRTETIPYETGTMEDASIFVGQHRIIRAGVPGTKEVTYRETYLGERKISSESIGETPLTEPQKELRAIGTKPYNGAGKTPYSTLTPQGFELDANGLPVHYQSSFDGVATAYYGGGLTSTGVPAAVGYVAVNPKVIPYGSRLWIVSLDGSYVYGYAIAADTGGFAKHGKVDVDLYMDTEAECCDFGKRAVRIYIL